MMPILWANSRFPDQSSKISSPELNITENTRKDNKVNILKNLKSELSNSLNLSRLCSLNNLGEAACIIGCASICTPPMKIITKPK